MSGKIAAAQVQAAQDHIAAAIQLGLATTLQFSGGKDSLACLYLARPWWDRIIVIWANAGDEFPETRAQMEAIKAMVPNFCEITGDAARSQLQQGFPVDLLPVNSTRFGRDMDPDVVNPALVMRYDCCAQNCWLPMHRALDQSGVKVLIRGQRDDERLRNSKFRDGSIDPETGMRVVLPIQSWTAGNVFAYLNQEGVDIPRQYSYGLTSLDCMHCTAYLHEKPRMLEYLADHHPEAEQELRRRLLIIEKVQSIELQQLHSVLHRTDENLEQLHVEAAQIA
jgi:phosphoadenosine phosphosulfate reductase